jgi:hypothetical protein
MQYARGVFYIRKERKSMCLGRSLDLGNVLLGLLGVSCLEDLYVQQFRNEQTGMRTWKERR